jgi:hypothetical protein
MARANSLEGNALEAAIEETRQGSAQEIEPLRDVAYNDVVLEFNRPDALIPLSPLQKILWVFARVNNRASTNEIYSRRPIHPGPPLYRQRAVLQI